MELEKANRIALHLMNKHGLIDKGWHFAFDRASSRLGLTHFAKKRISLSKHMVSAAELEVVVQTMLHEIAHALLPPSAKHGPEWKAKAASIGYKGKRLAENPARPDLTAQNRYFEERKKISAAESGVSVGDILRLPSGEYVRVERAARKKFHLKDVNSSKRWAIYFGFALQYKIG